MLQKQKITELFLQERRVRLTHNQLNSQSKHSNLNQTLKCFSLDKNSSRHFYSLKKVSKPKSYHLIKTPTKKQIENLAKLADFYQSQIYKKSNSSDKNLTRNKTSQTKYKSQRNSTFLGKLPQDHSTPLLPLKSLNQASTSSFLKEPIFGTNQKQQFCNIFPSQLYVHRPKRENGNDKKGQSPNLQSGSAFEAMMRRAFIPASKLKNSPRRMFIEKMK